jgi:hypothetical protein
MYMYIYIYIYIYLYIYIFIYIYLCVGPMCVYVCCVARHLYSIGVHKLYQSRAQGQMCSSFLFLVDLRELYQPSCTKHQSMKRDENTRVSLLHDGFYYITVLSISLSFALANCSLRFIILYSRFHPIAVHLVSQLLRRAYFARCAAMQDYLTLLQFAHSLRVILERASSL